MLLSVSDISVSLINDFVLNYLFLRLFVPGSDFLTSSDVFSS